VALMVIGIRTPWDPEPHPPNPDERQEARPLPRWFWPLFWARGPVLVVAVIFTGILDQRWILSVGVLIFVTSWVVSHIALYWPGAVDGWQRTAAIVRPLGLLAAFMAVVVSESFWWLLPGLLIYFGVWPITLYIERRLGDRDRRSGMSH
jgi:hypothetical protein